MEAPVRGDTGRESIDFNGISWNKPRRSKLSELAQGEARQVVDLV